MPKKIGIWGLGVVGKSALRFLRSPAFIQAQSSNNYEIIILERRTLTKSEKELISEHNATLLQGGDPEEVMAFFSSVDKVIVSPGIDLRPYAKYQSKFVGELDYFARFFKKPIVAITGTLGKTSTTTLLSRLSGILPVSSRKPSSSSPSSSSGSRDCAMPLKPGVAGNIGTGMLSLIGQQKGIDAAILELSSFQLAYAGLFAPKIGIWLNLYANHLDRHGSLEEYIDAKWQIFKNQTKEDVAIMALEVAKHPLIRPRIKKLLSRLCIISPRALNVEEQAWCSQLGAEVVCPEKGDVNLYEITQGARSTLLHAANFPSITFKENWLFVVAGLHYLGCDLSSVDEIGFEEVFKRAGVSLSIGHHRLEHFAAVHGIDFYNDSKATVFEATMAAIEKLSKNKRPLWVILGGTSKGVDRQPFVEKINAHEGVAGIVCFGSEWEQLSPDTTYPTLEEAVEALIAKVRPSDQVLFSPSGASFDLYDNYAHRGACFKTIVKRMSSEKRGASVAS